MRRILREPLQKKKLRGLGDERAPSVLSAALPEPTAFFPPEESETSSARKDRLRLWKCCQWRLLPFSDGMVDRQRMQMIGEICEICGRSKTAPARHRREKIAPRLWNPQLPMTLNKNNAVILSGVSVALATEMESKKPREVAVYGTSGGRKMGEQRAAGEWASR
jgi:hypothetical protein